jgi:hypothetical protein
MAPETAGKTWGRFAVTPRRYGTHVSHPHFPRSEGEPLTIDCDECAMQGTSACADCVVTFICSREPGEAVVVEVAEERALRLLSGAGLLPALRHVRRTG